MSTTPLPADPFFAQIGERIASTFDTNAKDENAVSFGRFLRAKRQSLGWTPAVLAQHLQQPEAEVVALEHGLVPVAQIADKTLEALAHVLGESLALFGLLLGRNLKYLTYPAPLKKAIILWRRGGVYLSSQAKRIRWIIWAISLAVLVVCGLYLFNHQGIAVARSLFKQEPAKINSYSYILIASIMLIVFLNLLFKSVWLRIRHLSRNKLGFTCKVCFFVSAMALSASLSFGLASSKTALQQMPQAQTAFEADVALQARIANPFLISADTNLTLTATAAQTRVLKTDGSSFSQSFADVAIYSPSSSYIEAMHNSGIVENAYIPNTSITRGETAMLAYRSLIDQTEVTNAAYVMACFAGTCRVNLPGSLPDINISWHDVHCTSNKRQLPTSAELYGFNNLRTRWYPRRANDSYLIATQQVWAQVGNNYNVNYLAPASDCPP